MESTVWMKTLNVLRERGWGKICRNPESKLCLGEALSLVVLDDSEKMYFGIVPPDRRLVAAYQKVADHLGIRTKTHLRLDSCIWRWNDAGERKWEDVEELLLALDAQDNATAAKQ